MATTTVYLLNYNNYYNRIIQKEDSVASYISAGTLIATQDNANFNPNDGVYTEFIFNTSNGNGDYVVVATDGEIDSRWFVIENRRNLGVQHTVRLYRDTIADNYSAVIQAPAFIEKATLPTSDPMIFNSEQMTFNQIKTDEYTVRDETAVPWIVGYIPRDFPTSDQTITATLPYSGSYDESVAGIANWSYYSYKDTNKTSYFSDYSWSVHMGATLIDGSPVWSYTTTIDGDGNKTGTVDTDTSGSGYALQGRTSSDAVTSAGYSDLQTYYENYLPSIIMLYSTTALKSYTNSVYRDLSNSTAADLINQAGKVIYDSNTTKYWKVVITQWTETATDKAVTSSDAVLYNGLDLTLNIQGAFSTYADTPDDSSFTVTYTYRTIRLTLEEVTNIVNATIPAARLNLNDNPWDMIAMPYGALDIYQNGSLINTTNADAAKAIAQAWSKEMASESQYDFQLLPFCPVRYMIAADGTFDIGTKSKIEITDGDGTVISYAFWASTSTFSFDVENVWDIIGIQAAISDVCAITNPKIQNETEFFRLVSPNYNGQFEFNAAKMTAGIDKFRINCTYIPYNPYIHVYPNFSGLYGDDFVDARGLICQGDFSIPQVSDAWTEYCYQNKNYQNSFNRDIENLEYTQKMAMIQSGISSVASAVSTGIGVGSLAGPVAGIAMGAISAAGAAADLAIQNDINKHVIDYRKDQFGYQLGNIQALNQSLTKNTALTANNKIWPILEFYQATAKEITALENKLKYNGMTVMRIGTISEFLQDDISYIKGKIIRLDSLTDDYTMANTIAQEIDKGVFI